MAIVSQTVLAARRQRVVVGGVLLLAVAVAALPMLVQHNGTARMFGQVMLTYNLAVITGLLGCITLWMACSAVAGELATGHLQLVATKPIARWQLWLGKWLGILGIDGVLLAASLAAVGGMLTWRGGELPEKEQAALRDQVLVARASVREAPLDLRGDVEALVNRRLSQPEARNIDPAVIREQMEALARARHETVAPQYRRVWSLDLSGVRREQAGGMLQVRTRFQAPSLVRTEVYPTVWSIGDVSGGRFLRMEKSLGAGVVHEFGVPVEWLPASGILQIECENRSGVTLLFRLEDGLEVLHRTGSFTGNLVRGGILILGWMALLAAVGLSASSVFSFPTAVLASGCLLYVGVSGGTLGEIVTEGTVFGVEEGVREVEVTWVDRVAVPVFRVLNRVVEAVAGFSPVSDLGTGREIAVVTLVEAWVKAVVGVGGLLAGAGIVVFRRRQLGLALEEA
jgi:hypothetical protein